MTQGSFASGQKLILGVRAAGLLLVGLGIAAPALFVGCFVQAVLSPTSTVPFAAYGLLDRMAQIVGSKAFLFRWLDSAGLWVVSLGLGLFLVTRSATSLLRLSARWSS